jgi:hypothetical protein
MIDITYENYFLPIIFIDRKYNLPNNHGNRTKEYLLTMEITFKNLLPIFYWWKEFSLTMISSQ